MQGYDPRMSFDSPDAAAFEDVVRRHDPVAQKLDESHVEPSAAGARL